MLETYWLMPMVTTTGTFRRRSTTGIRAPPGSNQRRITPVHSCPVRRWAVFSGIVMLVRSLPLFLRLITFSSPHCKRGFHENDRNLGDKALACENLQLYAALLYPESDHDTEKHDVSLLHVACHARSRRPAVATRDRSREQEKGGGERERAKEIDRLHVLLFIVGLIPERPRSLALRLVSRFEDWVTSFILRVVLDGLDMGSSCDYGSQLCECFARGQDELSRESTCMRDTYVVSPRSPFVAGRAIISINASNTYAPVGAIVWGTIHYGVVDYSALGVSTSRASSPLSAPGLIGRGGYPKFPTTFRHHCLKELEVRLRLFTHLSLERYFRHSRQRSSGCAAKQILCLDPAGFAVNAHLLLRPITTLPAPQRSTTR